MRTLAAAFLMLTSAASAQAFGGPNFAKAVHAAEYHAQHREARLSLALSYGADAEALIELLPAEGIAGVVDPEAQRTLTERFTTNIALLVEEGWIAYHTGNYHIAKERSTEATTYAARTGIPDHSISTLRTMANIQCERAMIAEGIQYLDYGMYTSALWELNEAWSCAREADIAPLASIPGLIVQAYEGLIQETLDAAEYREAYGKIRELDQYITDRNAQGTAMPLIAPTAVDRMRGECIEGLMQGVTRQQTEAGWKSARAELSSALADVHLDDGERAVLLRYAESMEKPDFAESPETQPQETLPEFMGPVNCLEPPENFIELDGGFVTPLLK